MNKLFSLLLIAIVLAMVGFGTWQLFQGNFEAAFSTLPFLLVIYFLVKQSRD